MDIIGAVLNAAKQLYEVKDQMEANKDMSQELSRRVQRVLPSIRGIPKSAIPKNVSGKGMIGMRFSLSVSLSPFCRKVHCVI